MPVKNLEEIKRKFASISKVTEGNTASSTAKVSLTVVFNRNGKRVTISKKLAETLKLADTAQLSFDIEDGVILLAKITSNNPDERIALELKNEMDKIKGVPTGKKIAYSADAAYGIVNSFDLDYTNCSSKSFTAIEIDSSDPDNPIAIITIKGA